MPVHLTRPLRAAGKALACVRFIAKVCGRLFLRSCLPQDSGREPKRLLKEIGPRRSRSSGLSLEDKWREELVILAREQSGRN